MVVSMPSFREYAMPSEDPSATPLARTAEKRNMVKKVTSAVANFFDPKPLEVDAKYKHGKHSVKDNAVIVTERNVFGKLKQRLTGNEQVRPPEYGRVLPAAAEWWFNHSTDLMNYWPNGPGEHHPFYDQWQMARTFVHTDGRVNKSLIMKAFAEDHDFYEKTMFFKRYNAIMLKNALGIEKVITHHRLGISRSAQKPLGDGILVPELAQGGGARMEKIIPSLLEAEASVVAALATVSLALTVAGGSIVLPPAVLATVGTYAAAAGIALLGGTGSYLVGRDSFLRIVRAAKERGELNNLATVCEQALKVIQSQGGDCDFMRAKFGIDPREIEVVGGKLHFKEGSTSGDWTTAQETLIQEEKFREWYLKDLVRLDHRALHGSHRRFGKVHLYEDQFLTEQGGKLVISQSGSTYERDWANRFEQLRRARNIPLIPANKDQLQLLYMEAGKQICMEIADKRFSSKVLPDLLKKDDTTIVTDHMGELGKRIRALNKGQGEEGAADAIPDGEERKKIKKGVSDRLKRSRQLVGGIPAEKGNPAVPGLTHVKDQFRKESSNTEAVPGIFDRQEHISAIYRDMSSEMMHISALYQAGADLRERSSVSSMRSAIASVEAQIAHIGHEKDGTTTSTIGTLQDALQIEEARHTQATTNITNQPIKGDNPEAERQTLYERENKTYDKNKVAIEVAIAKANEARTSLDQLLQKLKAKLLELEQEYAKLGYDAREWKNINGTVSLMQEAYDKLTTQYTPTGASTSRSRIMPDHLRNYGTPPYLMSNLTADVVASNFWTAAQAEDYSNQLSILYAVAEARAIGEYPDLHKIPLTNSEHAKIIDPNSGKISPEQLVTMSPYEVYDRVHSILGSSPPPSYDSATIDKIKVILVEERKRYEVRERALKEVMAIQERVVVRDQDAYDKVDEECDARQEQLVLLEGIIQDRSVAYGQAPEMVRTANLRKYSDGTNVGSTDITFSKAEMGHPMGYVMFLQDLFGYHTYDLDQSKAISKDVRSHKDLLKQSSREALFDSLNRSLGIPPERALAKLIIEGYGVDDFTDLLEPNVNPMLLIFHEVMAVLAYRHDHTLPRPVLNPNAYIAKARTADYPLKPLEMKKIIGSVIDSLIEKASAGNI